MKTFTLIFLTLAITVSANPPAFEMREIVPERSDAILFNPGMGLYLFEGPRLSYKPEKDAWPLEIADVVYFRTVWGDIEPDGPGSKFEEYFDPIFDFWVKKMGKRVAFRVASESMHSHLKYTTPKWVLDQGVPTVIHHGLRVDKQVDPVFWDKHYLDQCSQFVERLGKYLDGREGLEFVDIGSIGEWGEMHLGLHIPGRWTPEQLEETGFTREKYISAYRRIIDAHAQAFRNTRVFLNVGSYAEINDYAALRGCHFRQDGLTPRGASANVGKLYYHPYSRRGVMCNYEFHSGYKSMCEKGWDLKKTLEQGLSDPISYLNTNLMSPKAWEEAPQEVKELIMDTARRIGYRFVPVKIRVPKQLTAIVEPSSSDSKIKSRLIIEHTWQNIGVAPCYESYALEFTLHDVAGKIIASQLHYPHTATTLWWPKEEVKESTLLSFPAVTSPGEYTLKVAMFVPEKPEQKILLGINGRDNKDRYELCRIKAVAGKRRTGFVYKEDFEEKGHGWVMAKGIKGALDDSVFHEGKSSLKLEGTQQGSWSYISHNLDTAILPGSRYRLSCWLKVDSSKPVLKGLNLKIGLVNSENKWIANRHTSRYDTDKMGQWQHLTGKIETTLDAAGGHITLEKGGKESAVQIEAWIDDVQLELLEAP